VAIETYIIKGGVEGVERLKVLSRVMHPSTSTLLEHAGVGPGSHCLDVGCGGGEVTFEIARRAGATGRVVGMDLDAVKIELARRETDLRRLPGVEFFHGDVTTLELDASFDVVYARFLLTHLRDPEAMVARLCGLLRPGGALVVEDIDIGGYFCHPDHPSHRRYAELYLKTAQRKGVDPLIGPRLPGMLHEAGLEHVQANVVQPMALRGDAKLISPLTMKTITDSVLSESLASQEEVDQIQADLWRLAEDGGALMGMPRVVQAWGRKRPSPPRFTPPDV
jgi:ubiquinone/menaquinone biosynthesis C-methylase UbiE